MIKVIKESPRRFFPGDEVVFDDRLYDGDPMTGKVQKRLPDGDYKVKWNNGSIQEIDPYELLTLDEYYARVQEIGS